MQYYRGNFRVDRSAKGSDWLLGQFINEKSADVRGTNEMAVKFWHFSKGAKGHKTKYQRFATECTIVMKGKLKARVESEEFEFSEGEYVVIPPNVVSNLAIEALEDCEGITIKAPSIFPDDTVKLD